MGDFVFFTGEENEVEFLEKCLEQWNMTTNSEQPDLRKVMQLASVFHEIRHRLEELEEVNK